MPVIFVRISIRIPIGRRALAAITLGRTGSRPSAVIAVCPGIISGTSAKERHTQHERKRAQNERYPFQNITSNTNLVSTPYILSHKKRFVTTSAALFTLCLHRQARSRLSFCTSCRKSHSENRRNIQKNIFLKIVLTFLKIRVTLKPQSRQL